MFTVVAFLTQRFASYMTTHPRGYVFDMIVSKPSCDRADDRLGQYRAYLAWHAYARCFLLSHEGGSHVEGRDDRAEFLLRQALPLAAA